jgi:uncharacterized protein YqhQ
MEQQHTYGGQAVIEGVMIRGQDHVSVAVRRPDKSIAYQCQRLNPMFTGRLRRLFLVRGFIVLIETLTLGMRALSYSANVAAESEGQELGRGAMAGMIAVSLLVGIGIFFVGPVLASRSLESALGSDLLANAVEGAIRLVVFIGYLVLIGRMSDIRRVFMYHGAEHMTVHARENGEPLEVETVRRYPAAHPRCGTAFLLVVVVLSVVVFVFVGRDPLWWLLASRIVLIPFIAAASYELIRISGRYQRSPLVKLITGPSLALQALTTREPDDDQIEVAIKAMTVAVDADQGRGPSEDAG